jgi:lysophospholipase L1-like esterase
MLTLLGAGQGQNGVSYNATYQAILDYAITQGYTLPNDVQKSLENQIIDDLETSGIWYKLDTFAYLSTDGSSAYALIDWKRLTPYTPVNNPTFTLNEGFEGNGTSSYINTNYNPLTDAVNFQLNNASIGVYIRRAPAVPSGTKAVYGTGETQGITLLPHFTTNCSIRLNASTAVGVLADDQLGMWVISRPSSSNTTLYRRGKVNSLPRVSTGISDRDIFLLRRNDATPMYWGGQISAFFAGASLNEIEAKTLTASLENAIDGGGGNRMSVFFGDSITAGVGASVEANRWATLFSGLQGTTEMNYGRSGSMMVVNPLDIGWSMYEKQVLIPNFCKGVHKFLFFAFGTNDSRPPTPETVETFEDIYNEVLQTAYSRGWSNDRIKIVNIYRPPRTENTESAIALEASTLAFNNAIENICTTNNIQLMDITTVMTPEMLDDAVHPNDAGYLAMATYINTNIIL